MFSGSPSASQQHPSSSRHLSPSNRSSSPSSVIANSHKSRSHSKSSNSKSKSSFQDDSWVDDDDDAWDDDSDDDKFKARQAAVAASSSPSLVVSDGAGSVRAGHIPVSKGPQAPPARPHPPGINLGIALSPDQHSHPLQAGGSSSSGGSHHHSSTGKRQASWGSGIWDAWRSATSAVGASSSSLSVATSSATSPGSKPSTPGGSIGVGAGKPISPELVPPTVSVGSPGGEDNRSTTTSVAASPAASPIQPKSQPIPAPNPGNSSNSVFNPSSENIFNGGSPMARNPLPPRTPTGLPNGIPQRRQSKGPNDVTGEKRSKGIKDKKGKGHGHKTGGIGSGTGTKKGSDASDSESDGPPGDGYVPLSNANAQTLEEDIYEHRRNMSLAFAGGGESTSRGAGDGREDIRKTTNNAYAAGPEAVRVDWDDVLRDPLNSLARLNICDDSSASVLSPPTVPGDTSNRAPPSPSGSTSFKLEPSLSSSKDAISSSPALVSSDHFSKTREAEDGEIVIVDPTNPNNNQNPNTNPEPEGEEFIDGYELLRRKERRRLEKFVKILKMENVDIGELKKLGWSGIPADVRPVCWMLLEGYLPSASARRASTLARKRQEYADAVRLAFAKGQQGLDQQIWHQVSIDVPRTNAGVKLWRFEATQRSLEKILYVWAIRHPASGYVQGINDLVTPFFQVFLGSYIDTNPEDYDVANLPPGVLEALEADSFWCLSKLLDGIQDNYTFAQPGIQRQVARMKELCGRVDAPLANHLQEQNVEFIQFAFRWMNCLLMREMSVSNIVRMWDTYLSEGPDAFSEFHLYVCLAFLVKWSDKLRSMDFQGIIMFLQSLPTQEWTDKNIELLLSEAFMWKSLFHDAQGHFVRK